MKTKYFSLPVEFIENKSFSFDDSLISVDIKVMHDGLNFNNSTFSEEAIDNAKETLKNKPILGYIRKIDGTDEKDFAGHEIEITLDDDGVKVIYLERPLGVIPETNNYEIIEENDKKYVFCRGYLWKEYLNEGYDILKDNPKKSVSMEIAVDDYDINEDKTINIKKYRYLGITILGDDVQPAMEGAELNIVSQFSKNNNDDFYSKIEDLNNKISQYFNKAKDDKIVNEGGIDVKSKFATYNQKRESLRNALDPEIVKNENDEIIKETYYYVVDFDDDYVYVERDIWEDGNFEEDHGRFTYEFNEETLEATITSEFEKMVLVWLTEEENQRIQEERKSYETLKDNYKTLEEEVIGLREFKAQKEKEEFEAEQERQRQEKINHINTEYADISEDVRKLFIEKVDKYQTIDDIDADICVYIVKNKLNFSKTKKTSDNVKINLDDKNEDIKISPYGDLF